MPPRVHLIRHGEGFHQLDPLEEHRQIQDPGLTDVGVQRCKDFSVKFPEYIHIELVCASPLRRAIMTAKYFFESVIPTTPLHQILLLPFAQEDSDAPCDVGSPPEAIEQEFGDLVDLHMVSPDWTSKKGPYAATPSALKARAHRFRRWLRQRPEKEIVVVGHGAFWQYVTEELDTQHAARTLAGLKPWWDNIEWRSYTFAPDSIEDARLVEEKESVMRSFIIAER